jgi:hypothetical protein
MDMVKLLEMPNAHGRDGIHISAQLRVDANQLVAHNIDWTKRTMNTAADRIDELEDMLITATTAKELAEKQLAEIEEERYYADRPGEDN